MATAIQSLPIFIVEIGDRRLSASQKARISEFTFDEREKESAEAKVTLVGQAGERVSDLLPQEGDRFRVRWGYAGAVEDTGELRVFHSMPQFSDHTRIQITARDLGHNLGQSGAHHVFENTELGRVVEQLAAQAGLEAVLPRDAKGSIGGVETTKAVSFDGAQVKAPYQVLAQAQVPTAPREAKLLKRAVSLAQAGRSPRQLLQDIAAHVGLELHVEGRKLRLLPKHFSARPVVTLLYRHVSGTLLEFTPKEHRQRGKHEAGAGRTRAAGVDPNTGKPFEVAADDATQKGRPVLGRQNPNGGTALDGEQAGGDAVVVDSLDHGEVVRRGPAPPSGAPAAEAAQQAGAFLPTPSGSAQDAAARTAAKHRDAESGAVKVTLRAIGDPRIRKGRIVNARVGDPKHAGLYMVTSCSHRIGETYETGAEVRRHGVNKGGARTSGKPNTATSPNGQRKEQVFYRVDSLNHGEIVGAVVK